MEVIGRRVLQLVVLLGLCVVFYVAGTELAYAFTCSEQGCQDYAEGYCHEDGGVESVAFEEGSGFCHGFCGNGTWIMAFCDDT